MLLLFYKNCTTKYIMFCFSTIEIHVKYLIDFLSFITNKIRNFAKKKYMHINISRNMFFTFNRI